MLALTCMQLRSLDYGRWIAWYSICHSVCMGELTLATFWNDACATPTSAQLSTSTLAHIQKKWLYIWLKPTKTRKTGKHWWCWTANSQHRQESKCLQSYLIATILHAEYDPFLNNKICESKQTECSILHSRSLLQHLLTLLPLPLRAHTFVAIKSCRLIWCMLYDMKAQVSVNCVIA